MLTSRVFRIMVQQYRNPAKFLIWGFPHVRCAACQPKYKPMVELDFTKVNYLNEVWCFSFLLEIPELSLLAATCHQLTTFANSFDLDQVTSNLDPDQDPQYVSPDS